ncbi:hypothetical protein I7I53_10492 [Histoplasma capsulatum var. duboisii H88]|uniref:Uncharacterized protein n=1 Tax=Ajellomyces capsulatus (strain H88) TaxID=544711 RepID=A0A8A1LBY5_AJEC8|nr:hypothetical protein I7I53_10492 [Histoplasma capsulatum var. duboisii H88]
MNVSHAVQRHPSFDSTMNEPRIGPATGPTKVATANTAPPTPRVTGSQMSKMIPAMVAPVEAPNIPIRNRKIKIVSAL